MLKSLTTRTYEGPAGEPDAWSRPRDGRTEERAPWRSPYEQPSRVADRAAGARDAYAPRDPYASDQYARGAARPAPRSGGAGVDDFRELARSIERRRHASATAPATTPVYPTKPAPAPARRRSWLDDGRKAAPRREEHAAPGGQDARAALSREIASAADVARLEEMLTVVLRRLAALEGHRAERTAPPPATDEALSDAEARWIARRARAAAQRPARPVEPMNTAAATPARAAPRRLWS